MTITSDNWRFTHCKMQKTSTGPMRKQGSILEGLLKGFIMNADMFFLLLDR